MNLQSLGDRIVMLVEEPVSVFEFERTPAQELKAQLRDAQTAQRAAMRPADLAVNSTSSLPATFWGQKLGGNWYWRCEVPARHLPADVLQLRFTDLQPTDDGRVGMPRQKGQAAIWQFPGNATCPP